MRSCCPRQSALPDGEWEIALVGNPNTGKSTLFNRLTGIHQRTGNYPGVTVDKRIGTAKIGGREVTIVDLPGTYSLAATSADERVVIDVLIGRIPGTRRPNAVVMVADATNLMRNLFLASQVAETGLPLVVALNMADQARRRGIAIDPQVLSERLGVPVVETVASEGRGIDALRRAIEQALVEQPRFVPIDWPQPLRQAMATIGQNVLEQTGIEPNPAEVQRLLFDPQSAVAERLGWSAASYQQAVGQVHEKMKQGGFNPLSAESVIRYSHLGQLMEGLSASVHQSASRSESVDKILTHRFWGLFIFTGLMWLVFESIYAWAGPVMNGITSAFDWLGHTVGAALGGMPMAHSLVVDGVIAGVGSVVAFLPQILILFFFIALLEDTGYMARAAFLVDRLFRWSGLNGRSFVPMLSSYACAVPGIMATRTIEDPKARLTTILISPLMSCSARLPIYVLLIGAFIEPTYGPRWAAFGLFAMHLVGLVVAAPIAWLINRLLLKVTPKPFVMEMPRYHVPRVQDVLLRMWLRGLDFLKTAGTIIFAMSIVIWGLSYFPRPPAVAEQATWHFVQAEAATTGVTAEQLFERIEKGDDASLTERLHDAVEAAYIEQSYLGRAGKTVQPIFAPAGFDWKITVGIVGSFPAREVIISTLGIIYNLGSDVDEQSAMLRDTLKKATWPDGRRVFTVPVAVALMVFFALCLQCGATVATIVREAGWRWALFAFGYMSVLAWTGAVVCYQVGHLLAG